MHGPDYNTEQYRSDEYTSNDGRKRSSRDYGCSSNYTEVPLEIENGVYMIHARVNDVPMKFVFDTGASFISMSLTEAQFLYKQGTITDDDIIGSINFEDANGDISESMVVKLHTLQLGNLILRDVRASVVNNQSAPLLLGQSALQEFGSIKIDNKNHKIILENH